MKKLGIIFISLCALIACGCNEKVKKTNDKTTTTTTSQKQTITEQEAIEILKNTDYKKLDLPTNVSEYEIQVFGSTKIDDIDCYELGAFAQLENRKYNMGTFAVSFDGKKVYKIVDGEYKQA